MTVVRPVTAFMTAAIAGITVNVFGREKQRYQVERDLSCAIDACCDGGDCPPEDHKNHHPFKDKITSGFKYAFFELWSDLAGWFLAGLLIAGLITTLVPGEAIFKYLGGGLFSMIVMLCAGIPLYICATASTPIAAALILKGVSPGAALVFLLAGPATNVTSIAVLTKILGRRATAIYLIVIALLTVFFGLVVDEVYEIFGFSIRASVGQASELMPFWAEFLGAMIILLLSVRPVSQGIIKRIMGHKSLPVAGEVNAEDKQIQIMESSGCINPE